MGITMSRVERKDERGLVSFMITIVMMVVISLIVVGFTQVANRNRRQALDRQLSTQAFYAAESGVNDAIRVIRAAQAAGTPVASQTNCAGATYSTNATLNTNPLVKYTCVLVSPTVPNIETVATTQTSAVVPLNLTDSGGGNLPPSASVDLTFTWQVATSADPNPALCQSSGNFVPNNAANLCGYGLLRVDLMQMNAFNSATSAANNTKTFFMQPVQSGSAPTSFSSFGDPRGNIVPAACSAATRVCVGTLRMSGSAMTPLRYMARINTMYRDSPKVVIDGRTNTGSNAFFSDAQASIDVTGKAQDTLRRVKVRVPLKDFTTENLPLGGIQSQSAVCKRFTAYPGRYIPDDPINCP